MGATQWERRSDARQMDGASAGTGGLVDRAARMLRVPASSAEPEDRPIAEPSESVAEAYAVYCSDGYRRVTPVQAYRTPEDYHKRRLIKWLITGGFLALIGTALYLIIVSNIFGRFV